MGSGRPSLRWIPRLAAVATAVAGASSEGVTASSQGVLAAAASGSGDRSSGGDGGIVNLLRGSPSGPISPPAPARRRTPVLEAEGEESIERRTGIVGSAVMSIVSAVASVALNNEDDPDHGEVEHRIVGGAPVSSAATYPFMVLLTRGNAAWCGGAVVASDFILTAGHCWAVNGGQLGSVDKWDTGDHVVMFDITSQDQYFQHPNYSEAGYLNDLMLIQLNAPLDTTRFPPIAINGDANVPYSGQTVKTMGWGTMADGSRPNILQEVDVNYVEQGTCATAYGNNLVTDDMMCAWEPINKAKDACQGDSGGPLIVAGSPPTLVGTVSWGYECADDSVPGVYSRLSENFQWIKDTLCADSVDPPAWTGCSPAPTVQTQTGLNSGGPSPTPAPVQGTSQEPRKVEIEIKFDLYPIDFGWEIECGGSTISSKSHGAYPDAEYAQNAVPVQEIVDIPAGTPADCSVTFHDHWTNGLCEPSCTGHYAKALLLDQAGTQIQEILEVPGQLQSNGYFDTVAESFNL